MTSPRFTVETLPAMIDGQPIIRLSNTRTGAEARIAPTSGANIVGLRLPVRGRPYDLLASEDPPGMPARRYGAPVLFPYPNRVRDARYTWQGQQFHLPASRGPHAIHGLIIDRAFTVEEVETDTHWASVGVAIDSKDHLDLAPAYPFDFRLELTYWLGAGFRTQATVVNTGAMSMPFGIGFHPFFRVPLIESERREACRLQLWSPVIWETNSDNVPTGRQAPVPASLDPRGYPVLGTTAFDTYYTRLALDDPGSGTWTSRLLYPTAGIEVVVTADAAFREAVLFAPTNRPVASIEPYTCVADALNLQNKGIDAGLLVLEPGQRWTAGYTITARAVTFDPD